MHANISTTTRKAVYARDGYRCALCDNSRYLQIHHAIPRSQGGSNSIHNLICLCSRCHAQCHGIDLDELEITADEMQHYCIEYLADFYAPDWNPWKHDPWKRE